MGVDRASGSITWQQLCLIGLGLALLAIQVLIHRLSARFVFGVDLIRAPILEFIAFQFIAGLLFLIAVVLMSRVEPGRRLLAATILLGLLMRLALFGSTPILELDYYRYLWDGAVSYRGFNPYQLAPAQVGESGLAALSQMAGAVFERINYPQLRSIYPVLAQVAFALAHWLDAWNLDAWRLILLAADGVALVFIVKLLHRLGRSPLWSLVYWWNPLLLQQTYNAAHMDVLLVAPLVAAIWLLMTHRYLLSSLALSIAAGIKLWPVLLLAFVWRPLLAEPRRLIIAVSASGGMLLLSVAPLIFYGLGEDSGLAAFTQHWQRNSALFPLLESLLATAGVDAAIAARMLVAMALISITLLLNRRPAMNDEILLRRILIVIAALFLLSPAQFPWYCIWFLPLLCAQRDFALLLLTALMPIYYLKFYYIQQGNPGIFDQAIVWLQYLPVLMLLAYNELHRLRIQGWRVRHV